LILGFGVWLSNLFFLRAGRGSNLLRPHDLGRARLGWLTALALDVHAVERHEEPDESGPPPLRGDGGDSERPLAEHGRPQEPYHPESAAAHQNLLLRGGARLGEVDPAQGVEQEINPVTRYSRTIQVRPSCSTPGVNHEQKLSGWVRKRQAIAKRKMVPITNAGDILLL